jgi:hypothetical protein
MSIVFKEMDVVKITALLESNRPYTGTEGVCRAPRIGDLATVVHVLEPGCAFIAEAVDSEGYTLWLADFHVEELELEVKYGANI